MADDTSTRTPFRRLRVFLCHDLRDKQEKIHSDGRREKGIVLQLTEWLEAQDCTVWRSDKELFGGVAWEPKIFEQAIPTCDLFVICLTENFVEVTDGERHHEVIAARRVALNKHPDPDNTFIIPVRIHHVQYPGFKDKQYVNYYKGGNFEGLKLTLERKRQQLGDSKDNSDQSTSRQNKFSDSRGSTGIWNVPYRRNLHFTGRGEFLMQLDKYFTQEEQPLSTSTRRVGLTQPLAIKGLGGIGKTQIAVEYAHRSREQGHYTHTLWVNAASKETIITSFVAIAGLLLGFAANKETDHQKLIEAVKRWLEKCEHPWLLIFDNAFENDDDPSMIEPYLPRSSNGSILLTTRAQAVGSLATPIEVDIMGIIEGAALLLHRARGGLIDRASDDEINEASNIVVALDHFPLALDQAGAYLEETGCSFTDYLDLYQAQRQKVLARRGKQATNYPESVATTWSLSFQKVQQNSSAAAELLQLCSFLAPDRIPEDLIEDGATCWPSLLQQAAVDRFAFNQMIEELLKYSLVKRLAEDRALSIHRLVQAVQMDVMEREIQFQWAERVVRAVNDVFPDANDVTLWPRCLRYLAQVQACDTLIERYALRLSEAANLLNAAGNYLCFHALYVIAEPLFKRALSIREQQSGPEHPYTATTLNNLANLYYHQGKYEQAEPLFKRALSIREQQSGPEHPHTASVLNNLAALYLDQGKYEQAEELYQRALSIREQQYGPEHLHTAMSLNDLANLCHEQGRYEQAESLYQRALSIYEQQFGPEHPHTVSILQNLATLYADQGQYEQAEPLLKRALSIYEQWFGPAHPDIASNLQNLADLYHKQGQYKQAEPLYQRALSIREQQFGPTHPDIASSLQHLAVLYKAQNQYEQAELFYQRALDIYERILGPKHPRTQATHRSYTALLQAMGRNTEIGKPGEEPPELSPAK